MVPYSNQRQIFSLIDSEIYNLNIQENDLRSLYRQLKGSDP